MEDALEARNFANTKDEYDTQDALYREAKDIVDGLREEENRLTHNLEDDRLDEEAKQTAFDEAEGALQTFFTDNEIEDEFSFDGDAPERPAHEEEVAGDGEEAPAEEE